MNGIGIDIGSTYVKYCVLNEAGETVELARERTPVRQKEYFAAKLKGLLGCYPNSAIVSCGYGRRNIDSVKSISELSALAMGIHKRSPDTEAVLDIGGQDTKIIRQEGGRLKEFFLNEKCAAGSGLFLQNILNLLDLGLEDVVLPDAGREAPFKLSSVCAVFAQSEIVELIAGGAEPADIVSASLLQIFNQASRLVGKLDFAGELAISGGLTQIHGIGGFARQRLKRDVAIPEDAQYLSAIGCAVIAGGLQELA